MKKTDIAKLVADALEAEFGSYRNAELQHITALNDGLHGESQAVCLLLTKKGESLKAFKEREFSWMRHLFGQRLDLDYSAGLLLGFSRGMTEDAIFVDVNKSNLKLPLSLRKRPISAVLVKAYTDRKDAIANSDINKPHVTTYDVGELIAWAKEKGFVADEVLAAWEAYKKAEAAEAEQETAPATPDAVQPEPHTPRVERHTTKGKRRDTLTPVIEYAQSLCKDPWDVAEVWGQLHTLTAQKYAVLLHLDGAAVAYMDGEITKKLTKKNLGDRLREAHKKLV
jgi:hypothetical protein